MFVARAGLRTLNTDGHHPFAYRRKKKQKEKFRCYVPFMWPTCAAVSVGSIILAAGVLMCVVGYFSSEDSTRKDRGGANDTAAWNSTETGDSHLGGLTFVGPVFMGFGCFIIVVACVVVCETRDKMLKLITEAEKKKQKVTTKPDFYDLVIKQFKNKHRVALRRSSKVSHHSLAADAGVEGESGQRRCSRLFRQLRRPQSAKASYSHIGGALKNIPVQIFTIDMERTKKTSLPPVAVGTRKQPHVSMLRQNSGGSAKYPSASCIHDLLKDPHRKVPRTIEPLPAGLSWVTRPKTAFPDRRPMHRLTPLPTSDALYQAEAEATCSIKDSNAKPKQVPRHLSSDSDEEDARPEGCLCTRRAFDDRDYAITADSDLSEDRAISENFTPGQDIGGPTLLLHQASIHGEDDLSQGQEHPPSNASSVISLSSSSSMSVAIADSTLDFKRRCSSPDSFLSKSRCSGRYDGISCTFSGSAASLSGAEDAIVSTVVVASTSSSDDDDGGSNDSNYDGNNDEKSVVTVQVLSAVGLADSVVSTATPPVGRKGSLGVSNANTREADQKPDSTAGADGRQDSASLARESPSDLRRCLGPTSSLPDGKNVSELQDRAKVNCPAPNANCVSQVAV